MRVHREGRHLSGAEDLVRSEDLAEKLEEFATRFAPYANLPEDLGMPARCSITIDPVPAGTLREGTLLPVRRLLSRNEDETRSALPRLFSALLPEAASSRVLGFFTDVILGSPTRPGALLLTADGHPYPGGPPEGVRTTHVGCLPELRSAIDRAYSLILPPPSHRFSEALILASKVLSSPDILLELCASDDPRYTTGYLASRTTGYIRLPHLKKAGSPLGGRIYVVRNGADLPCLLSFLRSSPLLFTTQFPPSETFPDDLLLTLPSPGMTGTWEPQSARKGSI